jgi:hypothetical protein
VNVDRELYGMSGIKRVGMSSCLFMGLTYIGRSNQNSILSRNELGRDE